MLGTALALACAATAPADTDTGGASYDGTTATAPAGRHAMLGNPVRFTGKARPGTKVAVQLLESGAWQTVATAVADKHGRYVARWRSRPHRRLHAALRARRRARASAPRPSRIRCKVTIYKPAVATWYGSGWYGRKTACGQTLSRKLMGVAHKTLPCGTKVSFLYAGRPITVPVVDRGPYGAGISWDLTTAAADALGFLATGKGTVGAVSLRKR